MGRGKRKRRGFEGPEDSAAAMHALDPLGHGRGVRQAPRQPDGGPPPELIEQFIAEAKSEGCVCDPAVAIHRSVEGGGAIGLLHKSYCPLIRVLDEEAR